jgi:hypothetical protein
MTQDTNKKTEMMVDPSVAADADARLVSIFTRTLERIEDLVEEDDLNASMISAIGKFLSESNVNMETVRARSMIPADALANAATVPAIGYDSNTLSEAATEAQRHQAMADLADKLNLQRFAKDEQAGDDVAQQIAELDLAKYMTPEQLQEHEDAVAERDATDAELVDDGSHQVQGEFTDAEGGLIR